MIAMNRFEKRFWRNRQTAPTIFSDNNASKTFHFTTNHLLRLFKIFEPDVRK